MKPSSGTHGSTTFGIYQDEDMKVVEIGDPEDDVNLGLVLKLCGKPIEDTYSGKFLLDNFVEKFTTTVRFSKQKKLRFNEGWDINYYVIETNYVDKNGKYRGFEPSIALNTLNSVITTLKTRYKYTWDEIREGFANAQC